MLQFLNISMLFGAIGAAIPILIHLFSRRKRKVIVFSSLRFLTALEPRTLRWLRIKQRWLLLLRTAILAAIALALARPYWQPQGGHGAAPGPHRVAVLVDASLSMQAGGRWDVLQSRLRVLKKYLTPKDDFHVFWMGRDAASDHALSELEAAVTETASTPQASEVGSSLRQAVAWLDQVPESPRDLIVFSDFQPSTWDTATDSVLSRFSGNVFSVQCGEPLSNMALSRLRLETQVAEPDRALRLSVDLSNFSDQAVRRRLLRLSANGRTVAQQVVDAPADGRLNVVFELPHDGEENLLMTARLEPDAFTADDGRFAVLHLPPAPRMLILSAAPEMAQPLERALIAGRFSQWDGASVSVMSPASAWLPLLHSFQVLLVHNVTALASHEVEAVHQFVKNGGGLCLIPGSSIDLRAWTRDLLEPLMDVSVAGIATGVGDATLQLARPASSINFWQGLFNEAAKSFTSPEIRQLLTLRTGHAEVLLHTTGGRPWLIRSPKEKGRVLLLASGLEPAWSTLPASGFFAAMMHRAVVFLGASSLSLELDLQPGAPLVFNLKSSRPRHRLRVSTPSETWRTPTVDHRQGQWFAEAGSAEAPGFYRLWAADSLLAVLAVNTPPDESDLRVPGQDVLALQFPRAQCSYFEAEDDFDRALQRSRSGNPLWPWIWFLAGLLVAAEMLIARQPVEQKTKKEG